MSLSHVDWAVRHCQLQISLSWSDCMGIQRPLNIHKTDQREICGCKWGEEAGNWTRPAVMEAGVALLDKNGVNLAVTPACLSAYDQKLCQ